MLLDDLRKDIEAERLLTLEQMDMIKGGKASPRMLLVGMVGLAAINVLALALSPHYGSAWIAGSLLVVLVLSIVAFLPTTRSTAGIGGITIPFRKLRNIRGLNKRVLVALLVNAFLIGGLPMVPGMITLLGLNILFALLMFTAAAPHNAILVIWVIAQSALMIGFYLWLLHYRPYTSSFLSSLTHTIHTIRGEGGDTALRRRSLISFSLFMMVSAAVLLGIFVLPGFTLKLVGAPPGSMIGAYVSPLLVIIATQMFVVRAWQGEESRRWAIGFLENKRCVLSGLLDQIDHNPQADLEEARERLLITRIMRLQSHDLLGYLPIYSFFPDLDILLSRDLSEDLARISPGEALLTTEF